MPHSLAMTQRKFLGENGVRCRIEVNVDRLMAAVATQMQSERIYLDI